MASADKDHLRPSRSWSQRIAELGVSADMSPGEAKYIRYANTIAVFLCIFMLAYVPLEATLHRWLASASSVSYSLLMLGCLWLNSRGRYATVRQIFGIASPLSVALIALDAGEFSGVKYFLFTIPPVTLALFPPRERISLRVYCLLPVLAFFGVTIASRYWIVPTQNQMVRMMTYGTSMLGVFVALIALAYKGRSHNLEAEGQIEQERDRSESLLLNILPRPIAARLKGKPGTIADGFAEVTVLFADIVGFTTMSSGMAPERVVEMLNTIFSSFDDLATRLGLEKIKTIGDAYMVAGGLPQHRADHAETVAEMALGMLETVRRMRDGSGQPLNIRIGINTGPVVAGVIGRTKYIYDLWGDTVNTASRMESHGLPGSIQVTATTREKLGNLFRFQERGVIDVKGKGPMPVFLLLGRTETPTQIRAAGD